MNRLRNMVARHLDIEHEFCCITDDPAGIDSSVRIIPLWDDYRNQARYCRLKAFSEEAAEIIGPRFVSIDLDVVIVDDITPLVSRDDDFVAWQDMNYPRTPYCFSMFLLRAGSRCQVWDRFALPESRDITRTRRMVGSDQAWAGYMLGRDEPRWTNDDGCHSYRYELVNSHGGTPPNGARIIFFHGPYDPSVQIEDHGWIRDHWR